MDDSADAAAGGVVENPVPPIAGIPGIGGRGAPDTGMAYAGFEGIPGAGKEEDGIGGAADDGGNDAKSE